MHTATKVLERITFTTNMKDWHDAELVIEAVPEKIELKKEVFSFLNLKVL